MQALFVCYPKCSTCAKARKFLDENNISYDFRDIKEDRPSKEELKDWHQKSGLDIKKFFNTSGQAYRKLGLKDKLKEMSLEEKYQLLSTDGMLVKRPILVIDDKVTVGFKEDVWKEIIGK
ncbi:MAG: arsenate reductase family protein [Peptoniphilaceae bacterium]|nr:arsenate reductase family protein [Peptoniphilaceae bacterium]MDY6018236.1 arsenate reductase family protein [Anaerococcus sp.]